MRSDAMWAGLGRAAIGAAVLLGVGVAAAGPARADEVDADRAARVLSAVEGRSYDVASAWRPSATLVADGPGGTTPRPAPGVDVYGGAAPATAPVFVPSTASPYYTPGAPGVEREGARVGPNRQPEWTTQRRFARVRAYVLAPWQVEFESWWRGVYGDLDERGSHLFQEEIGIGLPYRLQLDLYGNFADKPGDEFHYAETQLELRWALADWGCLPLNPTLYFEYKIAARTEDPDVAELKFLLADEFCGRWHYGVNFAYERELDGAEEEVLGFAAALSYTVVDQRFSVGIEAQVERVTENGTRDDPVYEVIVGPSFQVRFDCRTHLDVVPLFGVNDDSPDLKLYVIFGVDIGPGVESRYGGPITYQAR